MWCNVNVRGQSKTILKTSCGLRNLIIWVFIVLDMKLSSLWNATKSKWKPGRETFVVGEVHFLMGQVGRTGREGGSSLMADSRQIKFSDLSMNRIVIIIFIFIFKEGGRSLLADSCQIELSDLRARSIFKISTWVIRCADWNITWPAGRFTVRGHLQRRQITGRLTFLALSTLLWKNIDLEHKLRGRRDGRWVQRGWNVVGIPQKLAIFFIHFQ